MGIAIALALGGLMLLLSGCENRNIEEKSSSTNSGGDPPKKDSPKKDSSSSKPPSSSIPIAPPSSMSSDPKSESEELLYKYRWKGGVVSDEFLEKVAEISGKLGVNPDDLMTIMATESGLTTGYSIYGSGAVGLIQFTNSSLDYVNAKNGSSTTLDQLSEMSGIEQLDYVYSYLSVQKNKMKNVTDIYIVTFAPYSEALQNTDEYFAIYEIGTKEYGWNKGLDHDKDGKLTRHDLQTQIDNHVENYREEIEVK